ncbi:MAG TPA: homoserine kinase [Acidobacteriaceae bacterium]|nr:homoserine kinase [Acidobacteriaceae bacterium]
MSGLFLKLPATSANLGPGFDTLALALDLYLEVRAHEAAEFSIQATGRSPEICGSLNRNLLLDVYRKTLTANGRDIKSLVLNVNNEIPLGMGCGSSAAVRLAGVALASHFGGLDWSREKILAEATRLEGHPDNAAACWLGGFVAASWDGETLHAVSFTPPAEWSALIVLPGKPLATVTSRAVLPESYSRADVVANLQRVAVLTGAFASGRASLIADAMKDRMHQPFRSEACPLLPRLLPLIGRDGILGVALSGAGPAVLVLVESDERVSAAKERIMSTVESLELAEILACQLAGTGSVIQHY